MFWKYNNTSSSEIETLLQRQDVTLQELMDSEDIISECRVQKKPLIDFLLKPEIIEELVGLTVREPPTELGESIRFKYPNIACELLTSDVPAINERLARDKILLDKLYGFLDCEPPLNPLLASYFSKIMGALIAKKTEQNWLSYQFTCLQVLDFLKAKDTFISLLLKHLGTSAIMDLTLKLMTQVEGVEMRQNILNWLDSQRIMQSFVTLLNPNIDKERHYNVAQLLCDFIVTVRDRFANSVERGDVEPLLNTLESSETITLLLNHIFSGEKSESAIIGGIKVLLVLLDVNQSSIPKINSNINDDVNDIEHKKNITNSIIKSIEKYLPQFHDVLLDPPKKSTISTTVDKLEPPLGKTRLHVIKLYAAIIQSNDVDLLNKIISVDTFPVILDLFFKYTWNNFLHTQVESCLVSALKTHEMIQDKSIALISHLIDNCKLIDRILAAWKDNDEKEKQPKGVRQGYMGHLINIINKIVIMCSETSLGTYLNDNYPDIANQLKNFRDTTLKETNAIQDSLLGGVYPNNTNDNTEYGDMTFPQEQLYSHYQSQHVASLCIDAYSGFGDDTFNDGDDNLQTDVSLETADGINGNQQELFKQICSQTMSAFDDFDNHMSDDHDRNAFQTIIKKNEQNELGYNSSGSDDDNTTIYYPQSPKAPSPLNMDQEGIDLLWDSSKVSDTEIVGPIKQIDPWCTDENKMHDISDGWADFNSVNFDTNFSDPFIDINEKTKHQCSPIGTSRNGNNIIREHHNEKIMPKLLSKDINSDNSVNNIAQYTLDINDTNNINQLKGTTSTTNIVPSGDYKMKIDNADDDDEDTIIEPPSNNTTSIESGSSINKEPIVLDNNN